MYTAYHIQTLRFHKVYQGFMDYIQPRIKKVTNVNQERILVLGATGMLGHSLFCRLSNNITFDVYATVRDKRPLNMIFSAKLLHHIYDGISVSDLNKINKIIEDLQPDLIINCIGIIKQIQKATDDIDTFTVNALFPHQLSVICAKKGIRLLQISTDCVFNGTKGNYTETDQPSAVDLYGITKRLGELLYDHSLTIRTSIIGHELRGKFGLLEWFLTQRDKVQGYNNAIFSGLPTVELSRVIEENIIPNPELNGLYHVSVSPISKFDLLTLLKEKYQSQVKIEPCAEYGINRSLDSTRFRKATGYTPPAWPELIDQMYQDFWTAPHYRYHHRR